MTSAMSSGVPARDERHPPAMIRREHGSCSPWLARTGRLRSDRPHVHAAMTRDRRGSEEMARLALGLDIGGTFTDVVMIDGASGAMWTAKTPSTPADPSVGFFTGVERILASAEAAPADIAAVFHGSTVATNA